MEYRKAPVFAAIGLVVVVILVAAAADPTGKLAVAVGAPAAVLLGFGILLYQWRWAQSQSETPVDTGASAGLSPADDLGQVRSQWDMYSILAVRPLNPEAAQRAHSGVFDLIRVNIKLAAAVMILPVAAAVIVISGEVPDLGDGAFVVVIPFALAPLALLWVRWSMSRAAESGGDLLKPLGLELTALPEVGVRGKIYGSGLQSDVRGATVIQGRRHGRTVVATFESEHTTVVSGAYPEFEIDRDRSGRLRATGEVPPEVERVLAEIGPSPRWKKLKQVRGGAEGIEATRRVDADGGWLWDLWLAERLAGGLGEERERAG